MSKSNVIKKNIPPKNPDIEQVQHCLYCSTPLPMDAHKSRKFCPRWVDTFGKVHDCKSEYHAQMNKPEREETKDYLNAISEDTKAIEAMLDKFGDTVTTANLDAFNLQLTRSLNYVISENGIIVSEFQKHRIISNPATKNHKIYTL